MVTQKHKMGKQLNKCITTVCYKQALRPNDLFVSQPIHHLAQHAKINRLYFFVARSKQMTPGAAKLNHW